jgi:hypothetical protein
LGKARGLTDMQTIRNKQYSGSDPATRVIIALDGEGWNIPLAPEARSANPHVRELVPDADGNLHERGWHSFVMLAGADGAGYRRHCMHDGSQDEPDGNRARNYGLGSDECLEFILGQPEDALLTGFYFSYDSIKLIADLPLENMRELASEKVIAQSDYDTRVRAIAREYGMSIPDVHKSRLVREASTVYNGYWIHFVPRKSLTVIDITEGKELVRNIYTNPETGEVRKYRPENRWKRSRTVWDVFGFFQASFINTLRAYRCGHCPGCKSDPQGACVTAPWTPADLDHIEKMKLNRGTFDPSQQAEILDYCYRECEYLVFLVRDLLVNIHGLGLTLSRFDGSGAVAAAWMKQERIKDYLPRREPGSESAFAYRSPDEATEYGAEWFYSGLPESVMLSGYFGGRFEITEIGSMGELYGFDINSAYPHITRNLPCLAHGSFRRVRDYVPGKFGIYLTGSHTSGRWAPFPFRTDERGGDESYSKDAIYYAHGGRRWVWANADERYSEIGIAREKFGPDAIPVYDGYVWEPECDHKPFAKIAQMYVERQEFVKHGIGLEKVIKLILNSLYGKTAQSIGWKIDRNGNPQPPETQCFIWAGLITSGCRAMILDAITQPGADVVSIATDGILSRTPLNLPHTDGEKILGEWDQETIRGGYLFQSGVYTFEKLNRKTGKWKRVYKTRGFSAREISWEALVSAWEAGERTVQASPDQTRFVTLRAGVTRENPLEYIGQWVPSVHDVQFTHNRRIPIPDEPEPGEFPDFLANARHSEPYVMPDGEISAPYEPKQSWDEVMEYQMPAGELDFLDA